MSSYIPGDPAGVYTMGREAGLMMTPQVSVPGYAGVSTAALGLSSWLGPLAAGAGAWFLMHQSKNATIKRLAPGLGLTTVFFVRWLMAKSVADALAPAGATQ